MTASIGNGFGQVLFQPNAKTCHVRPYAFHPMYNSAVPRGSTWGAHTTNVARLRRDRPLRVLQRDRPDHRRMHAGRRRRHDRRRRRPGLPRRVAVRGADPDHGVRPRRRRLRRAVVQARLAGHVHERGARPEGARHAVRGSRCPTSHGKTLENVAFETDLARIERGEPGNRQPECDGLTGAHCVNPPPGAKFYPIYTAAKDDGMCWLQQGGPHDPGHGEHVRRERRKTEYGQAPVRPLRQTPDSRRSGWPRTSTGISTATPARTDAG